MNFLFTKRNTFIYSIFLLVIFPVFSFANINFSEIMFDPDGADTNREWVEIKNTFSYSVDLEKYKFCDSGSCHKLYEGFGNDFKIPGNSFGILAKSPDDFKTDYPDFTGFILRSSFSINNTGELLELKDENGNIISVVEYNGDLGGKGGDSFSLIGDVWKNGKSTPGEENIFKEIESGTSTSATSSSSSASGSSQDIQRTYVEISDVIDGKKKLRAEIVDNIPTLMAGAENIFNGIAYGITGVEIKGAEYFWTLGDGEKEYGKNIKHTFLYPGEYVVTLIVKSSSFTGNTRKIVKVINSPVLVSEVDENKNWIKIKNNYSDILKLDNWEIFVDGEKFKIPRETYILKNSEVIFPNKITNLDVRKDSNIFLLFPNGEKQSKFIKESEVIISSKGIDNISEDEKKEVEGFLEKTKKAVSKVKKYVNKKVYEKGDDEKKVENFAQQNSSGNNDFYERNFLVNKISKDVEEKSMGKKGNFASQNFPQENLKIKENLILSSQGDFLKKNMYFILFIFLTGSLVLISFLIHYFQKKESAENKIMSEANEFDIEEI